MKNKLSLVVLLGFYCFLFFGQVQGGSKWSLIEIGMSSLVVTAVLAAILIVIDYLVCSAIRAIRKES